MTYAVIQDGMVVNLIWLYSGNEEGFPDAVPVGDLPVCIGDACSNGVFYRNGERLVTLLEASAAENADMRDALTVLGVNVDE